MHTENYEYSHKKGFGRSQLQVTIDIYGPYASATSDLFKILWVGFLRIFNF